MRFAILGAAMALAPLSGVANAQTSQVQPSQAQTAADARAAANLANDLAQCQLAASGVKTTGNAGISVALPPGVSAPACSPSTTANGTTTTTTTTNGSAPSTTTTSTSTTSSSSGTTSGTTSSSTSGSTRAAATCAAATRPLTAQETSMVNDYEIALAKAQASKGTLPTMSSDVAALIGCL